MVRAHIVVKGRVQGVGYRNWTYGQARRLGLCGWVRNLSSGDVEILAEGEKPAVEMFINELHAGPMLAQVTAVETQWLDRGDSPLDCFEVRRG